MVRPGHLWRRYHRPLEASSRTPAGESDIVGPAPSIPPGRVAILKGAPDRRSGVGGHYPQEVGRRTQAPHGTDDPGGGHGDGIRSPLPNPNACGGCDDNGAGDGGEVEGFQSPTGEIEIGAATLRLQPEEQHPGVSAGGICPEVCESLVCCDEPASLGLEPSKVPRPVIPANLAQQQLSPRTLSQQEDLRFDGASPRRF